MKKLDEKVVWITGASSGIGEALAYALANKNCSLILSARNTKRLTAVREQCSAKENVKLLPLDLAAHNTMEALAASAWQLFGHIDILINNAGISQRSLIAETDFEVYKSLIHVNYLGTVALTKALLPYFITQQRGHFVCVTSLMGKFGSPYRSGYCGAKHALHGFFDVLRMEHEQDGIAVTLICPGFVQTAVAKNALTADGSKQQANDKKTLEGLTAALFARKMISAIQHKKQEAYIGQKEVIGVWIKRFFPKLLHRLVMKSQVK